MKSIMGAKEMASAVLFLVTGAFWAGVVALGGGAYLGWGAITAILSGACLIALSTRWVTKPLATSSCLFGLVLTLYQVYIGLTGVGTAVQTPALYSVGLFAVFSAVYLYILYSVQMRKEEEA